MPSLMGYVLNLKGNKSCKCCMGLLRIFIYELLSFLWTYCVLLLLLWSITLFNLLYLKY